jgi:hypothetical protein
MDAHRLPGSGQGEERKRLNFDFYNQWAGIFGRNNWYDLTLICVQTEYSPYKGSAELFVALLGFGLTITYVYDWQFTDSISSKRDEVIADLHAMGATTVHDPFNELDKLEESKP